MCNQGQKQRFWLIASILLIAIFLNAGCSSSNSPVTNNTLRPAPATDRGSEIIAEYLKRDASPYRKDRVRFTVTEEDGKAESTEVDVWRKQADGFTTTLSLIAKPADEAGTGSLVVEEKDRPAVSVTYAASRDEFRETDTGKMFFGGLTIQELLGEWNKYDYKFIGERDVAGGKQWEVEGTLKPGQRSVVARSRIFFDTNTYLPVELRLSDTSGKELRVYSGAQIKTSGNRSYVAKIQADNRVYNSKTTIEVVSREYPEKLDDAIFTRERLKASAPK